MHGPKGVHIEGDPLYYVHIIFFLIEAWLGLEETVYNVSEGTDVEVCIIVYNPMIDCPIEFSFNVSFSTTNHSAGE